MHYIKLINYFSYIVMPIIIVIILLYGILEKKKVFDLFIKGANEGLNMVIKIFPTLIGLFLAIGALRSSGIIEGITKISKGFLEIINFPNELLPLAILRPISGGGSIAIATDIMKKYGVDSFIGLVSATIMGSTETTLYTIAIYTSSVKIKNIRFVLIVALLADITGMIASVGIWRILSKNFC